MDQPVVPLDLVRMFFGTQEPLFLVEIVVRTLVILAYTLLLLRWVGHRAVGQLSLIEFLLVIALGSAVGDSMFYPDVPIVHALLVITVVVVFDKTLDWIASRSATFSDYLTGKPSRLVRNGVVEIDALEEADMALSERHEQLRLAGVTNLGQVASAYLETNGRVSIFRRPRSETAPGLPILPPIEDSPPGTLKVGRNASGTGEAACRKCGAVRRIDGEELSCSRCGSAEWLEAATPDTSE
jgi:uncharacterized membrane protein YcaP (DUF421 family)